MRRQHLPAGCGVCLQAEDGAEDSEEEEEATEVDVVTHLLLHGTHAVEDV